MSLKTLASAGLLAATAVGGGAIVLATGADTQEAGTVSVGVAWPQPRGPGGVRIEALSYEWTLFYRTRIYAGDGKWASEARGIVAAGTTADTSVTVALTEPHPLDSLHTWFAIRAIKKRGLHGATTRSPQQLVKSWFDSMTYHPASNPDSLLSVEVTLPPGENVTWCVKLWYADTVYARTCPVPVRN